MASPPDLVSLPQAASYLAEIMPDNQAAQAALPFLVSSASRQIRQWTKRDFCLTTYSELYSGRGYSSIYLNQRPVNQVLRLRVNPSPILTVWNTDPVANQQATVSLHATGDYDGGQAVTGLDLWRISGGTPIATPTLLFATYTTVGALASAINAVGGGWAAIPLSAMTGQVNFANWPTADFAPSLQGAQGALAPNQAVFQAFTLDVSSWTFNQGTGEIRLNNSAYDPAFALMSLSSSSYISVFSPGFENIFVQYTAGYAKVPDDVQFACMVTVKEWLHKIQTNTKYTSESDVDWHAAIALPFLQAGLPDAAKTLLQPWRSFRSR